MYQAEAGTLMRYALAITHRTTREMLVTPPVFNQAYVHQRYEKLWYQKASRYSYSIRWQAWLEIREGQGHYVAPKWERETDANEGSREKKRIPPLIRWGYRGTKIVESVKLQGRGRPHAGLSGFWRWIRELWIVGIPLCTMLLYLYGYMLLVGWFAIIQDGKIEIKRVKQFNFCKWYLLPCSWNWCTQRCVLIGCWRNLMGSIL